MPCEFPEHHGGDGGIPWWVKAGAAMIVGGEIVHEVIEHARAIEDGFEVAAAILGVTILVIVLGLAAWRIGNRARVDLRQPDLPPVRQADPARPARIYAAPTRQAGPALRPHAVITPARAAELREANVVGEPESGIPADSA